jgi:hypothetical protein
MLAAAEEAIEQWPCLWLRGLLPKSFVTVQTPYQQEDELCFLDEVPAAGGWRFSKLWTDASGGEYGSIPQLRRCGIGITAITVTGQQGVQINFGAFGPLPGEIQTVPRGELYAIFSAFENTHLEQPLEVVTDSQVNEKLYQKGPRATQEAANYDLWHRLCAIMRARTAVSTIRWSKGHATATHLEKGQVSTEDMTGNYVADALADRAASLCQLREPEAAKVMWAKSLVKKI